MTDPFLALIKSACDVHGTSEVSRRIGVSRQTLYAWLSEDSSPTREHVARAAAVLLGMEGRPTPGLLSSYAALSRHVEVCVAELRRLGAGNDAYAHAAALVAGEVEP